MDIFHKTWFWVVVIGAPLVSVIGTLARLARKEPPIQLPPGVVPQPYRFDDEDEEEDDWGKKPAEGSGGKAEGADGPKEGADGPKEGADGPKEGADGPKEGADGPKKDNERDG